MKAEGHCIIRADFSATRTVAGRKVQQLIFEVAIEEADDVLARLGGFPHPGKSQPCAIALLENNGSASVSADMSPRLTQRPSSDTVAPAALHGETLSPITVSTAETGISETQSHARKSFSSLPLSQQAAIRCGDVLFQEFMKAENEEAAKHFVYRACGVTSRSQIKIDEPSGDSWDALEVRYQAWATDRKFAEAKR